MHMLKVASSKKVRIGILSAFVVLFFVAGVTIWDRGRDTILAQTASECGDYLGGSYDPVWPDNLTAFANRSYGIVVGDVLNPGEYDFSGQTDSPPRIRVTDVLKGSALHEGDILQLCKGTGVIHFDGENYNVLVFLDGKNQDIWVPLQGRVGIIPQSEDGHFNRKWADDSKTSATIDGLKQLIK
jgi:hypothetical protein